MRAQHALIWILSFTLACPAFAMEAARTPSRLDLPAEARPQIRGAIRTCQNMLVTADAIDDSVGIPFGANDAESFRQELETIIAKGEAERLRGGTFYVLGVTMAEQQSRQREFTAVLEALGLTALNLKIKVLSVPRKLIQEEAKNLAQQILERTRYFMPSITRDYQKPQRAEVISGLINAAVIEPPNLIFLYATMPTLDANLTAITHAVTLTALVIYSKSMVNWLLRVGGKTETANGIEIFLKQMLFSVPFVANYNIFGRFSEILKFYGTNGFAATAAAFPQEMVAFATTQGLTLALQTLFYSEVITKGFGRWMDAQIGEENSRDARALRPWLQTPPLMVNAVLLTMASSNWGEPLLVLGPTTVNIGHAALLSATIAGAAFFARFPRAFDRLIPIYRSLQKKLNRSKEL